MKTIKKSYAIDFAEKLKSLYPTPEQRETFALENDLTPWRVEGWVALDIKPMPVSVRVVCPLLGIDSEDILFESEDEELDEADRELNISDNDIDFDFESYFDD
jgi:hypothetical protein